jgi:hypothetical protein
MGLGRPVRRQLSRVGHAGPFTAEGKGPKASIPGWFFTGSGESWEAAGVGGDRVDFLISHAGSDRAWAEWVAWQLTEAGHTVEFDVWD